MTNIDYQYNNIHLYQLNIAPKKHSRCASNSFSVCQVHLFSFQKTQPKSSIFFCESLGAVPRTEAAPPVGPFQDRPSALAAFLKFKQAAPEEILTGKATRETGGNKMDDHGQNLRTFTKTQKNRCLNP